MIQSHPLQAVTAAAIQDHVNVVIHQAKGYQDDREFTLSPCDADSNPVHPCYEFPYICKQNAMRESFGRTVIKMSFVFHSFLGQDIPLERTIQGISSQNTGFRHKVTFLCLPHPGLNRFSGTTEVFGQGLSRKQTLLRDNPFHLVGVIPKVTGIAGRKGGGPISAGGAWRT